MSRLAINQRTLTALLLAPLAIVLILLAPTALFALVIAVMALQALWEWTRLAGFRQRPARALMLVAAAGLLALLWVDDNPLLLAAVLAAGVAWWLLALVWLRHVSYAAAPTREHAWLKLGTALLAIVPAWLGLVALHRSEPLGHAWTLLGLMLVWSADTGAYLAGTRLGRHKLAPTISPGKTWEGVAGGVLLALAVAAAGGALLGVRGFAFAPLLLLALLTVAAAIVGDLFESLLKRHALVKDSGTFFPGHGGILDRLDSVFAALPLFVLGKLLLGL